MIVEDLYRVLESFTRVDIVDVDGNYLVKRKMLSVVDSSILDMTVLRIYLLDGFITIKVY